MAYELRDGSGSLFKNDKRTKDTQPEYRGDCKIDGQEYWISGWIKPGANGKFFSLAITLKDVVAPSQDTPAVDDPLDDEVPF